MFLLCCNHFYGRGDTKEGLGEHDVLTSILIKLRKATGNSGLFLFLEPCLADLMQEVAAIQRPVDIATVKFVVRA